MKVFILLVLTSILPSFLLAAVSKFEFNGTVVEVDGASIGLVDVGDVVSGGFYYSDQLADSDSSVTFGFYQNLGDRSLSGFNFNFGGLSYQSDGDDLDQIAVSSAPFVSRSSFAYNWLFDASDNLADGSSVLTLTRYESDYFGSDDLPLLFTVEDFDHAEIEFNYDGHYLRASIDSISAIPEPQSIALLFSLASLLCVGFRRSRGC